MGLSAFLRLYGNLFALQNGQVRLKNYQTAAIESREERIARIMREDAERDAARAQRRQVLQNTRLGALRRAYGDRPA